MNLGPKATDQKPDEIERYDLASDPGEKNDVADTNPEVVIKLRVIMVKQHVKCDLFSSSPRENDMKHASKRFWRITLIDRGNDTVIGEIPTTHITSERIIGLMKMVYAKYFLTPEEIVKSHLRGNTKDHYDHFRVMRFESEDPISYWIPCGSSGVRAVIVRPEDQEQTPR